MEMVSYLNFLVYGDPGAGKTHLLGTAQDHVDTSPMLLIDVEGGTTTLRKRKDLDVISVRSIKDIEDAYKELYASIDVENNSMYYKTIGVDTLTEMQKLDMRDIMREVIQRRPDLDPDVPSMREWGKSAEHIRKIVRGFRDLPCNTIFTAHAAADVDNQTNVKTFYPQLPGKLKAEIPGFLDVVGYLTAVHEGDTITRQIQFAKTQRVMAKDRTNALGDVMQAPTIPMMWEAINAS